MHELSIALSVLDIASEESERRGGALITAIHLRLGPMSGVTKGALESSFQLARECSEFTNAELIIEDVPLTVYCATCGGVRPAQSVQMMCCARCGQPSSEIVTGRELEITAMEIEEHGPTCSGVVSNGEERE